jgi:hypothetical protein
VNIISRADWGATNPRKLSAVKSRTEFMIHYSTGDELGVADSAQWVRNIQHQHMAKNGWVDIGYNFLVDKTGVVFEGRGWSYVGAHCPNHNTQAIGVCYLGDDDPNYQDATPAARASIKKLYEMANTRYGTTLKLLGHRDGKATACPGNELYAWLKAGMPLEDVAPTPTPAPAPKPTPAPQPSIPSFPGTVQRGSKGDAVRQVQQRLRDRGWKIGVDGKFGPETDRIVRQFQAEKGLAVDGIAGPRTWDALWRAPVTR